MALSPTHNEPKQPTYSRRAAHFYVYINEADMPVASNLIQQSFTHIVFCAFIAAFGVASATECPEHYANGKAPEIINVKMAVRTQELCYEAFAVLHSGVTRTPLVSAEHLVRQNVEAAKALSRENSFHAETNLPPDARAELKDYARSGFDRGHMAPNGDMPTRSAQYESFTLANMVPQNPDNNRHVWAGIEAAVRDLAIAEGELYVISGPAFIGSDLQKIGNVLVPTHLYKVVYSPRHHRAGAYFVANAETKEYATLSVAQLERTIGINLLPGVDQRIKDVAMALPAPHNRRDGGGWKEQARTKSGDDASYKHSAAVLDAVEKLLKFLKK